ncbi:MAG: hypothetical protein JNK77_02265 [Saprospiraceae bacterium]|nr:hypothetical protein [Saprospiraceae bacterium]
MLRFIQNIGDYFASNYFDEDFLRKVTDKSGYAADDLKAFNSRLHALKDRYYRYKQEYLEGRLRDKDRVTLTHRWHRQLLEALGYNPQHAYDDWIYFDKKQVAPVCLQLFRGDQPHLLVMEMQSMIAAGETDPPGIFEQVYDVKLWEQVFHTPEGTELTPDVLNEAISEIFLLEQERRPQYILLLGGNTAYLLHYEKWFRGSYLLFSLEELFEQATAPRDRDYYALFYFLTGKDFLAPGADIILMEQLDEDSHKSAYAVTQDLKEGVEKAVEALANEAVWYLEKNNQLPDSLDEHFAQHLKDDCLTMVYRLLFVFYAESRPDLDILPTGDAVYQRGYSLDMLRDLEQAPLLSDHARHSYFFDESLKKLFALLSGGYREQTTDGEYTRSFRLRRLDSPLFNDANLHLLHAVRFRNIVWQDIIQQLSLSKKQRGKTRGRISYANLGINQLGSVYESLLAYRGFFAEQDYIEVHPAGKPGETRYLTPRSRLDEFKADEVLRDDEGKMVIHPRGRFIYRLSGRDRQKSASYYTPEVLTRTTVKYTLKPLLEKLEQGEMKALDLLDLKILEPAMGAAAFHNEAVNQLAAAYLDARQRELGRRVPPAHYQEELQKVKAWIATHNVYGVDLNPTAVELGKLSLWLNVIHRDMETPFFGYRLGVGNAVVGAWLKVYDKKDLIFEPLDKSGKKFKEKKWWQQAPKPLSFSATKINRKPSEIYHFLLPDAHMAPAAGIKILKDEYPAEAKAAKEWLSDFCLPIREQEFRQLQAISDRIDELLAQHYQFQRQVDACTRSKISIFGGVENQEQCELNLNNYEEKERLIEQRNRHNAPYFKLKMVMDYWCSLWCWDVRHAADLPNRAEFIGDISKILELDLEAALSGEEPTAPGDFARPQQASLFNEPRQLSLQSYRRPEAQQVTLDAITRYKDSATLFRDEQLLRVRQYAQHYRFFHYQLEFIEVFHERGGFDVAVGNPPWLKISFEEKGIISEKFPEVDIRNTSASEVRRLQHTFLENENLKTAYFDEYTDTESTSVFMNAPQNYPLLQGQQTNLYKCIIENGFQWINPGGYLGLLHPEGVYDDPKGQSLRKDIYTRLRYHFEHKNGLFLFKEVHDQVIFSINIYSGTKTDPSFFLINNLFHPSTIDGCFIHDGNGIIGGIKTKDGDGKYTWNTHPHRDRIVHIGEKQLRILAKTFENSDDWEAAKLVSIHSRQILDVLEKLSAFPTKVEDVVSMTSEGFHETNAQDKGIIKRETAFPDYERCELIYSGPHFFVGNPLYKTPRAVCSLNSHYDEIDLSRIPEDFVPRTNYKPAEDLLTFKGRIDGLKQIGTDNNGKPVYDQWIDYYKVCFSKMLSIAGERTLQPAIIPPKVSHTNGVISIILSDEEKLLELQALTSSIFLDFFVKTIGRGNLYDDTLNGIPLGIDNRYKHKLFLRTLLLNCLTRPYAPLWERNWREEWRQEQWSRADGRLKAFSGLSGQWAWGTPLRNAFERRQALVEIDVLTAMALGLSLQELILIYEVQFPVLQQNEDDTWYDRRGNIVFTCSKGLTGTGVDRKTWEQIRGLSAGETYIHIVDPARSELYGGEEIVYEAPFERCDRVGDYGRAWEWFGGEGERG